MIALIVKRILLTVPTLAVISIVSFVIIQLPPGDYLTSLIAAREAMGETVRQEEIARLRQEYALDQPMVVQYLRWMGGVLTGNLGQSFEHNKPVVALLGDRLWMTIVISIATVLFTWAVAVPIGIYSAVRQYSIGDYAFTFLGFLGIATPNFLLALIFMYVGLTVFGVSPGGLFSPEYQNAAWSWGKVGDLLAHLWVPVVVIGVNGTAGTIRILRANLLDELRKPYVVTARAKGLHPLKVLLKYPVRVALNPLVSTIGWLLPYIVSGSVIVSVVMSLPTVGELLLQALMNQDMYLAGSLVMLLSLLTVVGTLISDLLLIWLDPRIRMEQ